MKKKIFIENLNKALEVLRNKFSEDGKLANKIKIHESTGQISGTLGDYVFDYVDFVGVRNKGFLSTSLAQLFEMLIYVHYFDHLWKFSSFDLVDYINFDKFDKEKFIGDVENEVPIITSMNIIKQYAGQLLKEMKIENAQEIFEEKEDVLSLLNIIKNAMNKELHSYGDYDFLLSKIPTDDTCEVIKEISLHDQIFYTHKPEHIVGMAKVVKPGIYIIANVPYGRIAETAFYILFRFKKGTYLVENCKHSFRDQHYRTSSKGEKGEDRWLDRKYEDALLPVDVVLEFFESKSEGKEITLPGLDHSFRTLGKLSDSGPGPILWVHAFVDRCMQIFFEKKIEVTNAMSTEFIFPELEKGSSNIPIIYQNNIPTLSSMDLTWNPEKVEVDEGTGKYLEPYVPKSKLDIKKIPSGKLVPMAHIERELVFRQRIQDAKELEKKLIKDFEKNWQKVMSKIKEFIKSKNKEDLIKRALLNERYPMKEYAGFADRKEYPDGKSKMEGVQILYGFDFNIKSKDHGYGRSGYVNIVRPKDPFVQNFMNPWGENRCINFSSDSGRNIYEEKCLFCEKYKGRYNYVVQFLDFLQFESFFELNDKEKKKMPYQLRDFLNQERMCYSGNWILDDVDPLCLVDNPWWVGDLDQFKKYKRKQRDEPALFFTFNLCKYCKRKIEKL